MLPAEAGIGRFRHPPIPWHGGAFADRRRHAAPAADRPAPGRASQVQGRCGGRRPLDAWGCAREMPVPARSGPRTRRAYRRFPRPCRRAVARLPDPDGPPAGRDAGPYASRRTGDHRGGHARTPARHGFGQGGRTGGPRTRRERMPRSARIQRAGRLPCRNARPGRGTDAAVPLRSGPDADRQPLVSATSRRRWPDPDGWRITPAPARGCARRSSGMRPAARGDGFAPAADVLSAGPGGERGPGSVWAGIAARPDAGASRPVPGRQPSSRAAHDAAATLSTCRRPRGGRGLPDPPAPHPTPLDVRSPRPGRECGRVAASAPCSLSPGPAAGLPVCGCGSIPCPPARVAPA